MHKDTHEYMHKDVHKGTHKQMPKDMSKDRHKDTYGAQAHTQCLCQTVELKKPNCSKCSTKWF